MSRPHFRLCFLLLLMLPGRLTLLMAQEADTSSLKEHLRLAAAYDRSVMYVEAAVHLQQAMDIAKAQGREEDYLDASISLAEMMRKTGDYERGLEILYALGNAEKYPRINVRKLGRMAALHHEWFDPKLLTEEAHKDTILSLLNRALKLAKKHKLDEQTADLNNELGYFLSLSNQRDEGQLLLRKAADYYLTSGDTLGYVNSLIHILQNHIMLGEERQKDSLAGVLLEWTKVLTWPAGEIDIYNCLAYDAQQSGDSLASLKWMLEAEQSKNRLLAITNTARMSMLRIAYDTKKYQDQAALSEVVLQQKALELETEARRSKLLLTFLIGLGVFVLIVALLLFRESRLKQKVNRANERYQTLFVESNHRIKNNLQMVISMLEYARKDVSTASALSRMKAKIHTVSALHQYLSIEKHNQEVALDKYLNDIITLYSDISEASITVKQDIAVLMLPSERIIYFGLILNEMLANTIEHNTASLKEIVVRVESRNNTYRFHYSDGPWSVERTAGGLGSELIRNLVQRVGGKQFSLDEATGTYQFDFYA